ncbi:hypothetical protein AL057_06235 [Pseudomonas amygdali pv. myricae]|nr:hypothetical protein AL057_06235 [Pseudomonas amygdali pv. myricae]RMT47646.1 hypothetical protein ALP46_200269 [Pseudomonas amygdali pv. myricae]RMV05839.1 hypothetical protein ALP18_200233 [Pseudomonas amygdali pv. myricae]
MKFLCIRSVAFVETAAWMYSWLDLALGDGNFWDSGLQPQIIALKGGGCSIAETARLAGVSVSQVKRVWAQHQAKLQQMTVSAGLGHS